MDVQWECTILRLPHSWPTIIDSFFFEVQFEFQFWQNAHTIAETLVPYPVAVPTWMYKHSWSCVLHKGHVLVACLKLMVMSSFVQIQYLEKYYESITNLCVFDPTLYIYLYAHLSESSSWLSICIYHISAQAVYVYKSSYYLHGYHSCHQYFVPIF